MDENKKSVQKEEYQVIQEEIVPKKKNNWKRFGKTALRVAVSGVVFGVTAGVVFAFFGGFLIKKLGLEKQFRQVVGIGSATPEAGIVNPTKAPVTTKGPSDTVTLPPEFVVSTPEATPEITVTIDGNNNEDKVSYEGQSEDVREFLNMYSGIANLADELRNSLVQITAITEGVDWFEESYETSKSATGLYVGDNGLDMLFLTNLDSIEGATKFKVKFENGATFPCSIFAYDTNYRLAVLSVRLSAVSKLAKDELPQEAVFALDEVDVGIPVMVLGNPNGHPGAMELGMITGVSQVVQVIDNEILYFTTGITEYAEGEGFVFNLSGEVIGMVSNTLNKGEKGVITATMMSGMKQVIEDTLNNVPRIYCGLRLESVDSVMGGKYNLPQGIYVMEVLPSSPAMNAGIKNGDIITMVGIEPITGVRQFYEEINKIGTLTARVIVNREAKGERKEHTLYMQPETRLH